MVYRTGVLDSVDDTRAELLDRALELFAAYGYDGVGVQQICDAAGVTKPTLYHYFGSKRGVLEKLMEERLRALHAALAAVAAPERELAALLTNVASATFAYARTQPTFYRLYLTLWFAPARSEPCDVARRFHERHFEAIEQLFRKAERGRREAKGRRRALAAAFLGMLNNKISLALNDYVALTARLARKTVDEFLYGVRPRPEHDAPARRRRRVSIPSGK
jgi:TetR/AcrR family transcriptional regulator